MRSDLEIANSIKPLKINEIARILGLKESDLEHYGEYKAKLKLSTLETLKHKPKGKLILVSAITPTPAGEGKTTVSIGLAMALNKIGKLTSVALREPSLGPVFGMKGGAAGGGYSQVLPMEDINLHFTGDMHAVTSANNLLSALINNYIYQGNELQIDPRRLTWKRVLDVNDRMLRDVVIGLGGRSQGIPMEEGFDITPASEIMAILCLSNDLGELRRKIGEITVGYDYSGKPVYVKDLGFEGAITTLLKDAIKPNLVQTTEGTPAFVHGGPFANIAQGANSILATKTALRLSEYVVTEAGFGFDLGAEKFFDIVCPMGGFCTNATVLVATIRALKLHGGAKKSEINKPDLKALAAGLPNLAKHLESTAKFGMQSIIAINRFAEDTEEEINIVLEFAKSMGFDASVVDFHGKGGAGGIELAEKVSAMIESGKCKLNNLYERDLPVKDKIFKIAHEIYGAEAVDYQPAAIAALRTIKKYGYENMPVCIAKTQKSLSDNPKLLGRPKDFLVTVRDILISSGAGFLVPITGDIMRMPGLPEKPSALNMNIDEEGNITGLF
ncbi:MAG: formate--tetrahydrofolate ligase [Candidatus Cloacimonetes bacterium]|nr:formate--tetrahydrofolate ligase [Candidatus Cloacimonadota bacterium]